MHWQTTWLDEPLFADPARLFPSLGRFSAFPDAAALTALLPAGARSGGGAPLCFSHDEDDDRYYEARIFESGAVPTRAGNWHDFFNALIWAAFPGAKAAINGQHQADILAHGLSPRTLRRDALTLFDECGVLVVSSEPELLADLRQHRWQQVLWHERDRWGSSIRAYVFGHACYEMALRPFIGLTAKMLPMLAEPDFFRDDLAGQYRRLDGAFTALLDRNGLADKSLLSPLPLLGVPGWHPEASDGDFYENSDYFRPLRRQRTPLAAFPLLDRAARAG
ncbi:DUF3025 domain-containing protein [Gallaecimonas sp. GXIMD4217]|uniref:DUF3025 domain-containing protein n=1 Tax=Gallaecimonas sp. GXIMD4217 TaxID=3131927 RepID=UPI00311ADE31